MPSVRILDPEGKELLNCDYGKNKENYQKMFEPEWLAGKMKEIADKFPGKKPEEKKE